MGDLHRDHLVARSVTDLKTHTVSVIAAIPVSKASNKAQKTWLEKIAKRLEATSSMLGDMKAVKMLGLSSILEKIVSQLRYDEVQASQRFRYLILWEIVLCRFMMGSSHFESY